MNLERAIAIAVEAHAGQTDKAGAPYILHPLRVMLSLETPLERIVEVLHDVVEDRPDHWSFESLEAEGFGADVIAALRLVTKRPEDLGDDEATYLELIMETLNDPVARRVKIADIKDNLDVSRLATLTDRDAKRLNKYLMALNVLLQGNDGDIERTRKN